MRGRDEGEGRRIRGRDTSNIDFDLKHHQHVDSLISITKASLAGVGKERGKREEGGDLP